MNLVEAIRKANLQTGVQPQVPATEAITPEQFQPEPEHVQEFQGAVEQLTADPNINLVRLEVFMTHEQTQSLLRGALAVRHTVMTSAEVAHFLRLHKAQVESLAEQGQLPGFQVEGSWRFMKSAMEAWLMAQSQQGGKGHHVA